MLKGGPSDLPTPSALSSVGLPLSSSRTRGQKTTRNEAARQRNGHPLRRDDNAGKLGQHSYVSLLPSLTRDGCLSFVSVVGTFSKVNFVRGRSAESRPSRPVQEAPAGGWRDGPAVATCGRLPGCPHLPARALPAPRAGVCGQQLLQKQWQTASKAGSSTRLRFLP